MSIASRITSMTQHTKEAYDKIESLGADLIGVNKNLDNIADVLDDVYAGYPKVTGSGTSMSISNCKKAGMDIEYKGTDTSQVSLPSGYTAVDYIESSGTQYIDTGYKPNQDTGFYIDYITYNAIGSGSANFGSLFGSRTNWKTDGYQLTTFNDTNLKGHFLFGTADTVANIRYDAGIVTGTRQQISFKNYILTKADGNSINVTPMNFTAPQNLILFGRTEGTNKGEFGSMRLYNFKLWQSNVLVRNFVPCYRNSDNEVGLYDLVNGVFYTNQRTGTFTYGAVTSFPNPDYPQDIHTVKGNNTVLVEGKNKLPYPYTETTKTDKEVTFTVYSDGSILVNGTATGGNATLKLFGNSPMSSNLEFPAKYLSGGTSQVRLRAMNNTNENYTVLGTDTGDGAEINTTTYSKGYIELVVNNGTTVSNQTIKPMLLNNLSDRTFELYQAPGNYPVNLRGKNLFDKNNANIVNGWIDEPARMALSTSSGDRILYIPCKPNTTYTVSRNVITSSFRVTAYDNEPFPTPTSTSTEYAVETVTKNNSATSITYTTGVNAKYLAVHYGHTVVDAETIQESLNSIQIEERFYSYYLSVILGI